MGFKYAIPFLIVFLNIQIISSQTRKEIQYGFGLRTTIDLNGYHYKGKFSNLNVAFTAGAGLNPFEFKYAYTSLHTGFLFYSRGDLVSSYQKKFQKSFVLDFFADLTVNGGFYRENINYEERFVPVYHFGDFTPNVLQMPFQHSAGLGTIFVFSTDGYRQEQPQQIGFINFMLDRHFQFNMINDAWIFPKICMADGLDRYYTGGGMFSYHLDNSNFISQIEFSMYKFTGHEPYAFDAANLLQMDFIPFSRKVTYYYNKNRTRLLLSNPYKNFGIQLTAYNTDKDVQDFIHFTKDYTYHPDIFPDYKGFANELGRMGIGGFWSYYDRN